MTKQALKNKLDKLWKMRGAGECEVCQTLPLADRVNYTQLHPHHIIGRRNKLLRWDIRNRIWLCPTHHTLGGNEINAQNNDGGWFLNWKSDDDWMGKHRKADKEYLREKKIIPFKQWTKYELEELIEGFKNENIQ